MIAPTKIKIGKKELLFKASAAVSVRYKQTTGDDLLTAMQMGLDTDETFTVAYCMSEGFGKITLDDWLDGLSLAGLIEAAPKIIDLLNKDFESEEGDAPKNAETAEK